MTTWHELSGVVSQLNGERGVYLPDFRVNILISKSTYNVPKVLFIVTSSLFFIGTMKVRSAYTQ